MSDVTGKLSPTQLLTPHGGMEERIGRVKLGRLTGQIDGVFNR